jgi:2-deoxy-D-gluconate 3-dehydrogenase
MSDFLARLFDLTGKVALVTSARSGLGQAMALALASAGADIAGLGSSPMPETARLVEQTGRKFAEIRCDLAVLDDGDEVICGATQVSGPIDILVNCAGIIRRAPVTEMTLSDRDDVLDVNLRNLFLLSQSAARHMIAYQRAGRIINVASLLSFQGGIRVAAYAAAKHGVAGLTRAMANELAPKGHHRQCDRARLYGDGEYRGFARRCATLGRDPGAHPHGTLGCAGRRDERRRVPGSTGKRLRYRDGGHRRWRMARPLKGETVSV